MKNTLLHQIHIDLKAKMAEFAGYDMPIQYPEGVMAEHHWTRTNAGLFDVSHMGQVTLSGSGATALLERLTPSAFKNLAHGRCKYTVMLNDDGGMVDDLIVTRLNDDTYFLVINAGCKDKDIEWIRSHLTSDIDMTVMDGRALLALQGPASERVLKEALEIDAAGLNYMRWMAHGDCTLCRLGYTGEDGFEISLPAEHAAEAWRRLTAHPEVKPVGLAARDSLRMEMGYPLYGHDIDATTSPLEADIVWIMNKREDTDFIGSRRVMMERAHGTARRRVGIRLTAPGIAREGTELYDAKNIKIGVMTSGGFSPTLNAAIGMAYVDPGTKTGDAVMARVRGRDIPAIIADLPFVPAKTKKNNQKGK